MQTDNDYDYPDSYYAETLGKTPMRPALMHPLDVDVCVIGAGLAGLTTALELLRKGKSVCVLEAKRVAWGASGRNGGFVNVGFAGSTTDMVKRLGHKNAAEAFQLSVDGVDYVRRQIKDLKMGDVLEGEGEFRVYRTDDAQAALRDCTNTKDISGDDLTYYDTGQTRAIMNSERYHHAVYDPRGFHIDPLKYCHGLAAEIERLGGHIFEGTKARDLTRSGTGWKITAHEAAISARHVVLCTSAYDFKLYPPVSRAMQPVATYVMVTDPMKDLLDQVISSNACIADTRRAGNYYRRLPDGRLLWGGRITTRQSEPFQLAQIMGRDMLSVYPQLSTAETSHAWAGLMGYALHSMPLIGQVENGLWMATAFGGHGLNTTAMAGFLIAGAISGDDNRYKLFAPYKRNWAGGPVGRAGVQAKYWAMQIQDWFDEKNQ
ncbi:MAG: FAD-binding oxidoreductase [Amylibacter sp.]|nr:FAD-binding oxidoreductase [Amylibacter sp.]